MAKLIHTRFLAWFVCFLGAIFYCYEYFLRIIPSVITPDLMQFFGISAATLGNLVAFYYYAYTPMQLPVGVLMDKYGPRILLTLATFICAGGAFLFSSTDSYFVAAFGRFLVGFGSAFAFVGVLKLATLWLPQEKFAMVSGLVTMLGVISGMFGTIWVARVVEYGDWQTITILASFIGAVLAVVIYLIVRDSEDKNSSNQELKWTEIFNGFKLILSNYKIWVAGIVGAFLYSSLTVFSELWGVPFLMEAYSFTAVESASAIFMIYLGWAVGAPLMGWFSDRIQSRIFPLGMGLSISALAISFVIYASPLPHELLYSLLFIYGVSSSSEVVVFAFARELGPEELGGSSIAVVNMMVMLSGMLLQPLIGVILDYIWSGSYFDNIPLYSVDEYQLSMLIIPLGLILCLLLVNNLKITDNG